MKKPSHDRRRRPHSAGDSDESGNVRPLAGGAPGDAGESVDSELLADSLLRWIERLRPHAGAILALAGAALAALVAFAVVSSQAEARRAQSWEACLAALSSGDIAAFSDVVRRYPGTDAARWAEVLVADVAAAEGADLLFVDRQRAEGRLRAAVDAYSAVMQSRPGGLLAERAVFGLAKARESLGQLEESRRGYEAVAADFPGGPIAKLAATRAADLGRDATRQWYDWFASQKFTPPAASPSAAVGGEGGPAGASPVVPPSDAAPQPAPAAGQP